MVDQKEIKEDIKANSEICCPKCGSTQLSASKKKFRIKKTMLSSEYMGGLGLVTKDVEITCLKCGNKFKAAK